MNNALIAIALNIAVSLALFPAIGFVAVAIATSLASWVQVALLAWMLWKRGQFRPDDRLVNRTPRILAATAAVGLFAAFALQRRADIAHFLFGREWIAVMAIAGVGVVLYGALSVMLGAVRLSDYKAYARRRPSV